MMRRCLPAVFLASISISALAQSERYAGQISLRILPSGHARVYFNAPDMPTEQVHSLLESALGTKLRAVRAWSRDANFDSEVDTSEQFWRSGFRVHGAIQVDPLRELFEASEGDWLSIGIGAAKQTIITAEGDGVLDETRRESWFHSAVRLEKVVHWSADFSPIARSGIIDLMAFPLIAGLVMTGVTLWALRRARVDPAAAWFGYFAWTWALASLSILRGLQMLIGDSNASIALNASLPSMFSRNDALASFGLVLISYSLTRLVIAIVGYPVQSRVRHVRILLPQVVLSECLIGLSYFSVLLMISGLENLNPGSYQQAAWRFIFGAVTAGVCSNLSRRLRGIRFQTLQSGPLRDRLVELAAASKVRLRDLYVLHDERTSMANAFAAKGGSVVISYNLVDQLTRREVDAVMAHELGHHHRKDVQKYMLAFIAMFAVVGVVAAIMDSLFRDVSGYRDIGIYIGGAVGGLAVLFWIRSFEYASDAHAAQLTGDPLALLSGLGKVTRAAMLPQKWGFLPGLMMTHPTLDARASMLEKRLGLNGADVESALDGTLDTGEPYAVQSVEFEGKLLFSTEWKIKLAQAQTTVSVWAAATASAIVGSLSVTYRAETSLFAAIFAAAFVGFATLLAVYVCYGSRGYVALVGQLRPQLNELTSGVADASIIPITLAPGDSPRLFEMTWDWDIGHLVLGREGLAYVGERLQFFVPWDEIAAIELRPGPPGWIRSKRVCLRTSSGASFLLRVPAQFLTYLGASNPEQLRRRLKDAHDGIASLSELPAALRSLPAIEMPEVSARMPWEVIRIGGAVYNGVYAGIVAAIVALLLSPGFNSDDVTRALTVAGGGSALAQLVSLLPLLTARRK
jgi:Zn-dependent protease with chaperone function